VGKYYKNSCLKEYRRCEALSNQYPGLHMRNEHFGGQILTFMGRHTTGSWDHKATVVKTTRMNVRNLLKLWNSHISKSATQRLERKMQWDTLPFKSLRSVRLFFFKELNIFIQQGHIQCIKSDSKTFIMWQNIF